MAASKIETRFGFFQSDAMKHGGNGGARLEAAAPAAARDDREGSRFEGRARSLRNDDDFRLEMMCGASSDTRRRSAVGGAVGGSVLSLKTEKSTRKPVPLPLLNGKFEAMGRNGKEENQILISKVLKAMGRKRKIVKVVKPKNDPLPLLNSKSYEGDMFHELLAKLKGGIEAENCSKPEQLPDKIWIKQQFAVGVNDVTRVLERMPASESECYYTRNSNKSSLHQASVALQAVIISSDCSPRLLTKHIPALASSRGVPVIFVKDNKESSIRLGELLKLKTTMAIGVKVRANSINTVVDELLLLS